MHRTQSTAHILQMDFQLLKRKKPEYAKALENHLRQHKEIITREAQQQMMMAQMQGAMGG